MDKTCKNLITDNLMVQHTSTHWLFHPLAKNNKL